ncbi:hypothetical protein A3B87_01410 [Candidatus Kuenenbacteria bacterium RIFCSPHIGHO2_02_FULL_39_13]|uniref:AB hydrolase-1 domain-containing protein n=1 Tax=Candidatus Kuenenbacteria bacterium RIFCSPHIGHO2_02_FULL_39_13 TaxID=1798561 RepID=A0A1F6FNF1_9BACT|nr:MAG: hypothetical protein A3B87_01410 [Candidatus Kuenenbacteria bacterium RIFCSPHIGHO2_02_FULL_39_13]
MNESTFKRRLNKDEWSNDYGYLFEGKKLEREKDRAIIKLTFIRHGEKELTNSSETALTRRGIFEAAVVGAKRDKKDTFSINYSPTDRTKLTGEIANLSEKLEGEMKEEALLGVKNVFSKEYLKQLLDIKRKMLPSDASILSSEEARRVDEEAARLQMQEYFSHGSAMPDEKTISPDEMAGKIETIIRRYVGDLQDTQKYALNSIHEVLNVTHDFVVASFLKKALGEYGETIKPGEGFEVIIKSAKSENEDVELILFFRAKEYKLDPQDLGCSVDIIQEMHHKEEMQNTLAAHKELINIDDLSGTSVELYSPSQQKSDKLLLFIPGSGLNAQSGLKFYDHFLQAGYRTAGINLPGTLKTRLAHQELGEMDLAAYTQEVEKTLKHLENEIGVKAKNIVIVGHSLGAMLGLQAAKNDKYGAIILLAGGIIKDTLKKLAIPPEKIQSFSEQANKKSVLSRTENDLKRWFNGEKVMGLESVYKDCLGKDSAQASYDAYTKAVDVHQDDFIETPGLIITGRNDQSISVKLNQDTAEKLNFKFRTIDSSHMIPLSPNAHQAFESIERFVKSINKGEK